MARNASIPIFALHLEGPGVAGGGIGEDGAGGAQLLVHGFDVMPVDPYPGSGMALVVFAEEEAGGEGHEARAFKINFESKEAHIVFDEDSGVADDAVWRAGMPDLAGWRGAIAAVVSR